MQNLITTAIALIAVVALFSAHRCRVAAQVADARLAQQSAQIAELRRLIDLKDELIETVAHELRRPVGNIKMLVGVVFELPEEQRGRYREAIRSESQHAVGLIKDLLELQQLNSGQDLNLEPLDINWISEMVDPWEQRANLHGQTLEFKTSPHLPPVCSDRAILYRIISELLNNAIKYSPAGATITFTVYHSGGRHWLSVRNPGSIPQDELSRIFDKFYRLQSGGEGTGLGLAIVRSLAEVLGGAIAVSSSNGEVEFVVELPA